MMMLDWHPLLRIADISDKIATSSILSTINFKKICQQIPISEMDIFKTSCATFLILRIYQNAFRIIERLQSFQKYMNSICEHTVEFAAFYIDDIIKFSRSTEEHENHIDEILQTQTATSYICKWNEAHRVGHQSHS